jgi:aryl-alcohol dehydrogenase-like predicted oxidoreductase
MSFGSQRIVDEHNCTEEDAVRIVNTAIDRGINYFDTAPSYSEGQSEYRLGLALGKRRDQIWLVTKTHDRTRDGSLKLLEESFKRLKTDHVDEWRLHHISSVEELDQCFAPDGALQALLKAKEQGMVKHLSISCHNDPTLIVQALRRFDFDSVLIALSALDHMIYNFEGILPALNQKGIAIVAMKALGMGKLGPWYERALRYTMSLPVSTTIVGMESMEQLEKNLAVAESFEPLSEVERLEFWQEIMPLATPPNIPWKAQEWGGETWFERVNTKR